MQALQVLRQRIKEIKHEKNALSAQFKLAKDDPEALKNLRSAMAEISKELKGYEQRRKSLEAFLESLQSSTTDDAPEPSPFPARFQPTPTRRPSGEVVSIDKIGDHEAKEWDAYVEGNPRASLYHLYAWRRIVEESFGHSCHYYAARDQQGKMRGILPLVRLQSRLFGNYGVSMPFFNYGGPLADNQNNMIQLMQAVAEDPSLNGWEHVEYRSCEAGLGLANSSRKVSMILRLPKDQESLERELGSKVRAQYKQTDQHQPVLKVGGLELLDDYYCVFSRAMRDLGTPVYGKSFFRSILRHMGNRATLVCVYINQRPAAAAFLLGFRDMLEIPWAAALREYNRYNVNMWTYRQILGFAIEGGYSYFDFGRSTVDAGTYRFKKQWGARPLQHYWYYQFPLPQQQDVQAQALPALNPDNPKYRLAIAAWKRLPVLIANNLGPHIVKNLP